MVDAEPRKGVGLSARAELKPFLIAICSCFVRDSFLGDVGESCFFAPDVVSIPFFDSLGYLSFPLGDKSFPFETACVVLGTRGLVSLFFVAFEGLSCRLLGGPESTGLTGFFSFSPFPKGLKGELLSFLGGAGESLKDLEGFLVSGCLSVPAGVVVLAYGRWEEDEEAEA
jgi:hypothetical protein